MLRRLFLFLSPLFLAMPAVCLGQERFSIFVGSDPTNVERMIKLAELRDDDRIIDLGSGDGRIVIGAALAHLKIEGIGVDIDPKLVSESTTAASKAGVGERVRFMRQNVFDADLSKVSVIFMWLWPEMQTMLRPKILAEARPGTRVAQATSGIWAAGGRTASTPTDHRSACGSCRHDFKETGRGTSPFAASRARMAPFSSSTFKRPRASSGG